MFIFNSNHAKYNGQNTFVFKWKPFHQQINFPQGVRERRPIDRSKIQQARQTGFCLIKHLVALPSVQSTRTATRSANTRNTEGNVFASICGNRTQEDYTLSRNYFDKIVAN